MGRITVGLVPQGLPLKCLSCIGGNFHVQFLGGDGAPDLPDQNNILLAGGIIMKTKMTMIYWKGEKFWLGRLLEHPEIMTQGESLEELEENIKDAYLMMAMDDVPKEYEMKEVTI
ncbi:MAG: type II toxin-antitoxin system HicB family antitoxin [bacterium]